MRILSWAIGLVLALVIILFAVSNRQVVELALWPLQGTVPVRLFIPILAFSFLAFLLGGFIAWLSNSSWRRLARRCGRQVDELEHRLRATQERLDAAKAPLPHGRPGVPAHNVTALPTSTANPALRQVSGARGA